MRTAALAWPRVGSAFLPFLELADRARLGQLVRAIADPMAIRAFVSYE